MNFSKNLDVYEGELEKLIFDNYETLQNKVQTILNDFNTKSDDIINDFKLTKKNISETISSKSDVTERSILMKDKFDHLRSEIDSKLTPLVTHINRISFDINEELLQGAYKEQYEKMHQQWSQVQETAQLGVAVEIIDHEFNVLYSKINRLLESLEKDESISKNTEFELLEKTFRSLEDKYNLLSPLYRINSAASKEIRCSKIVSYVEHFFDKKLEEEKIIVSASESFKNHSIKIKEPILYTIVINIVNNAIYWMKNSDKKEINFDYNVLTKEIIIKNSGLKIENHRIEKIFDLFYSNRPNGRGIGLYLAKESLNEAGYRIYATNDSEYNTLNGACFVIKPITHEHISNL